MNKILLDTCALIWWSLDPQKLSPKGKKLAADFDGQGVYLSAISLWEVGIKIARKKLDIGMSLESYILKLSQVSALNILPVDIATVITSINLNWSHQDPADRFIVATAQLNGCTVFTNDQRIMDFYERTLF